MWQEGVTMLLECPNLALTWRK